MIKTRDIKVRLDITEENKKQGEDNDLIMKTDGDDLKISP
jgi:hypothetical protein